jgi:hypothetical protein
MCAHAHLLAMIIGGRSRYLTGMLTFEQTRYKSLNHLFCFDSFKRADVLTRSILNVSVLVSQAIRLPRQNFRPPVPRDDLGCLFLLFNTIYR